MKVVVKEKKLFSQTHNEIMALSDTGCCGTDSLKRVQNENK